MIGYLWLVVTAMLWGCSDPLLKRFGESCGNNERTYGFLSLLANWKYLAAFLTNQLGGVIYMYALAEAESSLNVVIPVTNGLKFAFTLLTGRVLGEKQLDTRRTLGVLCILAGVTLQVNSQS